MSSPPPPPPASPRSAAGRPRLTRRDRLVLGLGAALAIAAPVVAYAQVRARCAGDLGAELTALAGVPARIGLVDAGLTGTVRLSDVAIGDLFAARAIEARVALPNLLAGRLSADEIEVEAPVVRAQIGGGDADVLAVLRRIAARRAAAGAGHGGASRSLHRIVVTEGDLVVSIAGVGTIAASGVELHPQAGGVRVLTTRIAVKAAALGVTVDGGFARAAADVALPAVGLRRLVATGGDGRLRGPGGPTAVLGAATLTYGAGDAARVVHLRGDIDDAGVPRGLQLALSRDAVAIAVDHVPLAAAAPWLPPAVRLADARLTGTIDAARIAGNLAVSARGELTGGELRSAAIADHPVPVDLAGTFDLAIRGGVVDGAAALATGPARVAVTAHLDRGASGWDHGAITIAVPPTPCLELLDAVPRALRGASAGLTVEGTAGARLDLRVDGTAEPGAAVRLAAAIDVDGCRALAEAPRGDPAILRAVREHVFPDGSRASVGPDRDGWVALADLPRHVPGAFVAAEDARFWDHRGFDLEQIARSLEVDLRERRLARGGSTISQQLVKNVFLGQERTFGRKLEEAILTWRLEATTDKRTILEQYLNLIELGPGVFGIAAAARYWFATAPEHLSVREAAFLAALAPEPRSMSARIAAAGALDPRSRERVDTVLRAMKRADVIDADRYDRARDATLDLRRHP